MSAVFLSRSPPSFYTGSITEPGAYQLLSINTNYPASGKDLLVYACTALGWQACTATPDCFTWVLGEPDSCNHVCTEPRSQHWLFDQALVYSLESQWRLCSGEVTELVTSWEDAERLCATALFFLMRLLCTGLGAHGQVQNMHCSATESFIEGCLRGGGLGSVEVGLELCLLNYMQQLVYIYSQNLSLVFSSIQDKLKGHRIDNPQAREDSGWIFAELG